MSVLWERQGLRRRNEPEVEPPMLLWSIVLGSIVGALFLYFMACVRAL